MTKYLAVASTKAELISIAKFAETLHHGDRLVLIRHPLFYCEQISISRAVSKNAYDYLNKKDLVAIEKECLRLVNGWFRFDLGFEKSLLFKGIQLGLLPIGEVSVFFRENLQFLKGLLNAIGKELPDEILTGKNSLAGEAVRLVALKKSFKRVRYFDAAKQRLFPYFPNLTLKKIIQSKEKLQKILAGLFKPGGKAKGRKTIFIASRGYLGSLEQKLQDSGCFNVFSLERFLLGQSINPFVAMAPFLKRKILQQKYAAAFNQLRQSRAFQENMAFDGMRIACLFEFKTRQFVELNFPEFVFLVERIGRLFKKQRPAALVLWEDFVPFERICALTAKKYNVPSIVIQHGIFSSPLHATGFISGFAPLTADRIAVWNQAFKNILENNGVHPGRIVVTGSPKFDSIYNRQFDAKRFKQKLGIPADKKLIVCATQAGTATKNPFEMVKHVLNALKKFPEFALVIKVHPTEKKEEYVELLRKAKAKAIVLGQTDLYELLNAASAVIIHSSTVGVEAMLLGTPVVMFAEKRENIREYNLSDAILKAKNEKELQSALALISQGGKKLAMLQEKIRRLCPRLNSRCDGRACERIIELIKKTIKQA